MSDSQFETYKLEKEVARMAAMETVTGRVVRINGSGFLVDTRDGWLNVSKYAHPLDVPMPRVGDNVRLKLDKAGYVREIRVLTSEQPTAQPEAQPEPETPTHTMGDIDDKQRLIIRQSVLKVAVEIATSDGKATTTKDVLSIAEQLESWVLR